MKYKNSNNTNAFAISNSSPYYTKPIKTYIQIHKPQFIKTNKHYTKYLPLLQREVIHNQFQHKYQNPTSQPLPTPKPTSFEKTKTTISKPLHTPTSKTNSTPKTNKKILTK